jgi:hypothetical protein
MTSIADADPWSVPRLPFSVMRRPNSEKLKRPVFGSRPVR